MAFADVAAGRRGFRAGALAIWIATACGSGNHPSGDTGGVVVVVDADAPAGDALGVDVAQSHGDAQAPVDGPAADGPRPEAPAADATSDDGADGSPFPSCPPVGSTICTSGPRGRVVTSFGPGDCFATATTGAVWPVPGQAGGAAHALFCGDIAATFGTEGTLDYPPCGLIAAITTPTCHQTGGGSAPPATYAWTFQCDLADGGVCATTISFLDGL